MTANDSGGVSGENGKSLVGHQRKFLRGKAHGLRPLVQVGEAGLTDGVAHAMDAALLRHELIKVRMQRPGDKRALAQELAENAGAEICGLVGHTVILYRRHPEEPRIELPARVT